MKFLSGILGWLLLGSSNEKNKQEFTGAIKSFFSEKTSEIATKLSSLIKKLFNN